MNIDQCFICKEWFEELVLVPVKIPDQGGGHVQKLVCKGCQGKIVDRSENGES